MFQGYILAIGAGFSNGGIFTSFQLWYWSSFLIFMPRFWDLIVLVGLRSGISGLRRHFYLVCLMGGLVILGSCMMLQRDVALIL